MNKKQLSDFYLSFVSFMTLSKQQIIAIGAKHDLTGVQAHTLFFIDPDNPQPMSVLSSILSCDASNITGIIDGLEQKNLISRKEKPGDRRVKTICLEPAGLAVRQQFLDELSSACEEHIFAAFDAEEKQQFASLIAKATQQCPLQRLSSHSTSDK